MTPENPRPEHASCTVAPPSACNLQLSPSERATRHATAVQPGSLKRLATAVLQRNQQCNQCATPTEKVMQLGPPENGVKVASEAPRVAPPVARSETELRIALAIAAEGLPITLDVLLREFGAEGREGWEAGDYAHPAFLRAFAKTVAERLERDRESESAQAPGPLSNLPLLREDRRFIQARIHYRRDRDRLLSEYAKHWKQAADAEPVEHRQANAGRRAANKWLREITGGRSHETA